MESKYRPSFGWLMLGMTWGTLAGHIIAVHFVMLRSYPLEHMRPWAYMLVAGAIAGTGVGAVVDTTTKRSTHWLYWLGFAIIAALYLLFFSPPMFNVVRE